MPSRRAVLRLALATVPLAGCASDVHYPEERPGMPDVVLKNCTQDPVDLHLAVTHLDADASVHDHTHPVPEEFCSDMGPSYEIEDVWTDAGEYRLRAEAQGYDPAEATATVAASALEDDTVTRWITVDDREISMPF